MATDSDDPFQQFLNVALNSDSRGEAYVSVEYFTRALEIAPDADWVLQVHHWRADAYCRKEDHQSAIKDRLAAIRMAPDEAAGYCGAGVCYDHLGQHGMAIEYLDQAIRLEPTPDHCLLRGLVRHHQGAYEEAIKELDQALHYWHTRPSTKGQLNELSEQTALSELGEIYYYRGLSHFSLGDLKTARSDIEKSVLYLPEGCESHVAMSLVHVAEGSMREAMDYLDRAFNLVPSDVSLFLSIQEFRSTIEGWLDTEVPTARDKANHSVEEFIFSVLKAIQ